MGLEFGSLANKKPCHRDEYSPYIKLSTFSSIFAMTSFLDLANFFDLADTFF